MGAEVLSLSVHIELERRKLVTGVTVRVEVCNTLSRRYLQFSSQHRSQHSAVNDKYYSDLVSNIYIDWLYDYG